MFTAQPVDGCTRRATKSFRGDSNGEEPSDHDVHRRHRFTDDKVSYLEWCKAKTLELVKQGKVELPLPRPPP